MSAYNADKPAFVNMLRAHRLDFEAFFAYATRVGALAPQSRGACLEAWHRGAGAADDNCPGTASG